MALEYIPPAPSLQVVGVPVSEKVYKDLTSVEVAPSALPCTTHKKVTSRQPTAEEPDVFELYPVTTSHDPTTQHHILHLTSHDLTT